MDSRPIYMDCHATTPCDQRVVDAMLPFFTEQFGNPASAGHGYGWEALDAVQRSRQMLAQAINASSEEIVFTSGASEANNLAIKGIAEAYQHQGRHIITVATEHNAVLDPCRYLQTKGFEVTYLPVQADGVIDLGDLLMAFRPDTILVSVMTANNETGVLQPIAEIGAICQSRHVLFHTDAAQAIGKVPLNVDTMHVDLMSLTAHKIYGPKGIGALYVRRENPAVQLLPQMHGGGQERGMRSGTLYTPQIVGFAKAVELGLAEMDAEAVRLSQLRDRLWQQLQPLGGLYLNGNATRRLPGNLNISIAGVDGQALREALQSTVAVSSGSACSSAKSTPSYVLKALGRSDDLAFSSIRFGIGRYNAEADVDRVAEATRAAIESLRKACLQTV